MSDHRFAALEDNVEHAGMGCCSCGWPPIKVKRLATADEHAQHRTRAHVLARRRTLRMRVWLRLQNGKRSAWNAIMFGEGK